MLMEIVHDCFHGGFPDGHYYFERDGNRERRKNGNCILLRQSGLGRILV